MKLYIMCMRLFTSVIKRKIISRNYYAQSQLSSIIISIIFFPGFENEYPASSTLAILVYTISRY